jgi:DNA-binding NtrC family response regulator
VPEHALGALQVERQVDPVGGSKPVAIDVRVVAATHRDLEAEIAAGRFREDLYYRLNVLPLHTCPLRERPEDLPELLGFFAKRFAPRGQSAITFTDDFMSALQAYPWPGNVRELSNLVDRFSTLFTGEHLALGTVPAGVANTLDGLKKAGVPVFAYGNFLTIVINFALMAFVIFMLVRYLAKMKARLISEAPAAPPAPPPASELLLAEIRDELRRRPAVN